MCGLHVIQTTVHATQVRDRQYLSILRFAHGMTHAAWVDKRAMPAALSMQLKYKHAHHPLVGLMSPVLSITGKCMHRVAVPAHLAS